MGVYSIITAPVIQLEDAADKRPGWEQAFESRAYFLSY